MSIHARYLRKWFLYKAITKPKGINSLNTRRTQKENVKKNVFSQKRLMAAGLVRTVWPLHSLPYLSCSFDFLPLTLGTFQINIFFWESSSIGPLYSLCYNARSRLKELGLQNNIL